MLAASDQSGSAADNNFKQAFQGCTGRHFSDWVRSVFMDAWLTVRHCVEVEEGFANFFPDTGDWDFA